MNHFVSFSMAMLNYQRTLLNPNWVWTILKPWKTWDVLGYTTVTKHFATCLLPLFSCQVVPPHSWGSGGGQFVYCMSHGIPCCNLSPTDIFMISPDAARSLKLSTAGGDQECRYPHISYIVYQYINVYHQHCFRIHAGSVFHVKSRSNWWVSPSTSTQAVWLNSHSFWQNNLIPNWSKKNINIHK